MKKVIINFLHPHIYKAINDEEKINVVRGLLGIQEKELDCEFVWGEEECDYLFVSESFYYGQYVKETRKKYNNILKRCNPIIIFHAGECIEPDFNLFDYAIVFDRNLKYDDRCCRMPTTLRFYKSIIIDKNYIDTKEKALEELKNKKYFCNFIYSNPDAHPNRDKLFYSLSKYKTVYSLGRHLNNFTIPKEELKNNDDWRKESIEIKSKFKFSIASENACYPGYTSEKIITSLEANTVPIYWGDPLIKLEFNEEAFINANDFSSFDELVEYIKEVDENDDLWSEIISKPWKTEKQIEDENIQIDNYKSFIKNIFMRDVLEGKRIAQGFHPNNYRNAFNEWENRKELKEIINRIKTKIKNKVRK